LTNTCYICTLAKSGADAKPAQQPGSNPAKCRGHPPTRLHGSGDNLGPAASGHTTTATIVHSEVGTL